MIGRRMRYTTHDSGPVETDNPSHLASFHQYRSRGFVGNTARGAANATARRCAQPPRKSIGGGFCSVNRQTRAAKTGDPGKNGQGRRWSYRVNGAVNHLLFSWKLGPSNLPCPEGTSNRSAPYLLHGRPLVFSPTSSCCRSPAFQLYRRERAQLSTIHSFIAHH